MNTDDAWKKVPDTFNGDELADAAILEYLKAMDSGRLFDVEAWLQRYASVREELLEFLDDQALACSDSPLPPTNLRLAVADLEATTDFQLSAEKSFETASASGSMTRKAGQGSPPQVVGGIRLGRLLGSGGMGRVYEGIDAANQPVAVKLLAPAWASSVESIARFRKEGALASVINHPRCVFIRSADTDNGVPYIVMELMPGDTLKDLVARRGPLPYREAVQLILDVAEGLEEAHSRGMIHRDVKPANCYMEASGRVKIGDFGLARSVVEGSDLTVTGGFVGTPLYASPEQIRGKPLDARTDIYSLAATLFFLISGRAPFASENATQTIARIVSEDPPSLREQVANVPQGLDVVLSKGLARDPVARFQSIADFRNALLPFMADGPVSAPLGMRLLAMLVDIGIYSFLMSIFFFLYNPRDLFIPTAKAFWYVVLGGPLWLLYLFLQEWLNGATIGKRLFRLRVVDTNTLETAKWYQYLLRSACFVAVSGYLVEVWSMFAGVSSSPFHLLAYFGSLFAGYGLVLITYRLRGERALLHDWVGHCRVVPQPELSTDAAIVDVSSAWVTARSQREAFERPPGVGRFEILAGVSDDSNALNERRVLLARDPQLERNVWLVSPSMTGTVEREVTNGNGKSDGRASLATEELSQSRTTRLRLIEQVTERGTAWDAFIAIEGESVEQLIARQSQWSWTQVRALLEQFVAEVVAGEQVGKPLRIRSLSQLWVDTRGRLVMLDFPLNPSQPLAQTPLTSLCVAHALAIGLLAGGRGGGSGFQNLPPLPAHATRILRKLTGDGEQHYSEVSELQRDLEQTQRAATRVSVKHRIVQVALMAILASGVYGATLSMARLGNQIGIANSADALITASFARKMQRDSQLYDEWKAFVEADPGRVALADIPPRDQLDDLADALDQKYSGEFSLRYKHATFFQKLMFEPGPYSPSLIEKRETFEWEPPNEQSTHYLFRGQGEYTGLSPEFRHAAVYPRSMARDLIAAKELGSQLPRSWALILLLSTSPVLAMMLWDVVFRGGWCAWFAGIRYVDRHNLRVGFLRFALRAAVVWSPIVGLGLVIAVLDLRAEPWRLQVATVLNAVYQLIPFPYVLVTLLHPQRAWHDRVVGTYPVPR